MEWLGKKYQLYKSENFDEYMKALGVNFFVRKAGNAVWPVVELKKTDDQYNLLTTSTFKSTSITFKLGEEFDEVTADGRNVKSIMTMDGNKLCHQQTSADGIKSVIIREFGPTEAKVVMEFGGVTCTRLFKAI